MSNFYAMSALRGDGEMQPMSDFEGKVVYATNVASK
jgi:glutathione peroxidase-family protein